jgi:putative oxidoreductase
MKAELATLWGRVFNLTLWVLQGLTALVFLPSGATKFDRQEVYWVELFAKIGIGQWFRYFAGGLEVVCSILLVIPKTSFVAALLLACTMVGAILVNLFVLWEPPIVDVLPVSLLILTLVAWKGCADSSKFQARGAHT